MSEVRVVMVGGCSKSGLRSIDRGGVAALTCSCVSEDSLRRTFPLPSVSGYTLRAALNTSSQDGNKGLVALRTG